MKKTFLSLILTLFLFTSSFCFMPSAKASDIAAGTVSAKGSRLNVRKSASTSSEILTSLNDKTVVAIYGKSGSWYKVEYSEGKYGYCHSDYITPSSSAYKAYVNTSGSVLNVRTGAGTSYAVKAKLTNGSAVTVISKGSSFHKVIYKGTNVGYVSASYLKTSSASYGKIALSVPSYKQTDSRWKDVTIGSKGGTIGTIGCTTTALAMTESYRTGEAITPVTMRNKLSYTASGSLYWPSNYNTELVSASNYLSKIYSVLKEGKPVILGANSTSGKQHWVVVTGHSAISSSLSPSNFTVNDPGSKTRTTLSSFLGAYQNVYKIAYYK